MLAALLALLAFAMIAQARCGTPVPAEGVERLGAPAALRVLAVVAALAAMAALLEPLGFRVVMTVFRFFLPVLLGAQRLPLAAAIALFGGFGGHALFDGLLGVPLPSGIFGFRRAMDENLALLMG